MAASRLLARGGECGHDLNIVRRAGPPNLVERGKRFDFILVSPQCPADSHWSPELVVSLVEHVSRSLAVDRDRVYLTGYSMGGLGVWETACYDPDRFSAIAPVCGGGDTNQAKRLVGVPIWAFHGEKDEVMPLPLHQAMVDVVEKCGGHVKFTIYPGCGHSVGGMTYRNPQLYEWLLAQRRNVPQKESQP